MATVGSGFTGDGGRVNSPSFKQKALPWAEVVRGEVESSSSVVAVEQVALTECSTVKDVGTVVAVTDNPSPLDGYDGNDGGNAVLSRKPVWNKVANGGVEVVGPVMGAVSWPALSEAAKVSSRSVVADPSSPMPILNGVIPTQVPAASNAPLTQVNNSNPNPTPRHAFQGRPRPMRRGPGGSNSGRPAQSGFVRTPPPPPPPPPPPFPLLDFSQGNYVNFMPVMPHAPSRDSPYPTRPVTGFAPSHAVNNQFSHRNPSRRPRGENLNNNNPGGRSEHERRNPELNSRGSNGRDLHMQHPRAPPGTFLRHPPPGSPTFITPPLVGPFATPMPYNDMRPPFIIIPPMHSDHFSNMPFYPHEQTSPMGFPVSDNTLPTLLLNQINFYFSEGNLEQDEYLRSKMDADGWVHIIVIAGFPRVKKLTNDTHFILEALQPSAVVEVKDGKVRKRNDWKKYTLLPFGKSSTSDNELAKNLKKLELEEGGSSNQSSITAKEGPTSEADPIRSLVDGSE